MLDLWVCRRARGCGVPDAASSLEPVVAACVSEGIRRDTGIISWLHWPDLVTIGGRAVAASSVSACEQARGDLGLIFSISVDCFSGSPLNSSGGLPSTSIRDSLGVEVDLGLLRQKILHAVDWYYAEWEAGRLERLVQRIAPTVSWLGGEVEVRLAGGAVLHGTASGLDGRGSLLLKVQDRAGGRVVILRPKDVELVLAR